jgi:hypothetical protein
MTVTKAAAAEADLSDFITKALHEAERSLRSVMNTLYGDSS